MCKVKKRRFKRCDPGEVCFGEGDGEGVKRVAEGIGVCTEHIDT